jgi:hypothetical protein
MKETREMAIDRSEGWCMLKRTCWKVDYSRTGRVGATRSKFVEMHLEGVGGKSNYIRLRTAPSNQPRLVKLAYICELFGDDIGTAKNSP